MGKGITRRRYGRGHPRPGSRARALYPPRWTLGENPSSQPGRDLARKYKTAQNFRNWWLRISGTHSTNRAGRFSKPPHSATLPPLRGLLSTAYHQTTRTHWPITKNVSQENENISTRPRGWNRVSFAQGPLLAREAPVFNERMAV